MAPTIIASILIRIALPLALLCFLVSGADAESGRRVALVIGNGAYQNAPALPNPARDAKAVAARTARTRFRGDRGSRPRPTDMEARLDEFSGRLEGAATALFDFAGHGI